MVQFIIQLWRRYQSVLSYLIFGGLTTVINFIVFGIFDQFWPYWIANTIAWLLSVLFAYVTNKRWVFESHTPTFRAVLAEMTSFFGFRLLSYFVDQGIMIVGISVLHGNSLLVKLIDQIIIVLLNWFFSKLFIFKDRQH
ncbi:MULTISPECIES: GtrA family protein [Lactiplantibacillus]|uniref:GtrA family protein n=1 Tax=Lactiplantibacillus pentosus TaxID=1589 RepID=A0AB37RI25_LACPE|nr:GtrA family protein [Lactiplantibacillus pentosus]MBU7446781.1 GtrA family protein [Lactiplantibacillus sp. 7.2.4]MBU7479446.1 GtrA family protein [Lactiplantibacillus pentosus]MBU7502153.1 GtrA family protein [Lactiplantibacillus pentosus]MDY1544487.1 GtrA family protein [Lactiplantibacillus pentosus]PRO84988.1 GtrA family protein [Lactiplantibacillus pentosus]